MRLDSRSLQDFLDELCEEYNRKTILGEKDYVIPKDETTGVYRKCDKEIDIPIERLDLPHLKTHIGSIVSKITSCESSMFIQGLDSKTDTEVQIEADADIKDGNDLYLSISKEITKFSNPKYIFLPEKPEYTWVLSNRDFGAIPGIRNSDPVIWFDHSIFGNNGFVVDSGMYVDQKEQSQSSIVRGEVDINEPPEDNSKNKIMVNLIRSREGKISLYTWTNFILPQKVDGSIVKRLKLPDLDLVQDS